MRQVLVDVDRTTVQRLQDDLLRSFPELPPGLVLGAVTRSRRDLARHGRGEGLWDAVELVARQRLLDVVDARGHGPRPEVPDDAGSGGRCPRRDSNSRPTG